MSHSSEEIIILQFMSYAAIPFKAEVNATSLLIDWGNGDVITYNEIDHIEYFYPSEGLQCIKMIGEDISYLNVSHLGLTELVLVNCPRLEYLNCSGNELCTLDIDTCCVLEELQCNSNNLKQLIIPHYHLINYINASYNALERLQVSFCKSLRTLYCDNNQLNNLDMTGCDLINEISISNNCLMPEVLYGLFEQLPEKNEDDYAIIYCYNNLEPENFNKLRFKSKKWH